MEETQMRRYRIGDYAKYMGVTPDLLKHYEDLGLIRSERMDNGYRYYPFYTSAFLLECIRLRNYGMTLREIRDVLADGKVSSEAMQARLRRNMDLLQDEITLNQLLIRDYQYCQEVQDMLADRSGEWEIRRSREMLFLPHTKRFDFLQDERIYQILKDWMANVPVVKSVMKIDPEKGNIWGLAARKEDLDLLRIPVNEVVETVPGEKALLYYYKSPVLYVQDENAKNEKHAAIRLLRQLHLQMAGPYYRVSLMPSDWTNAVGNQYGCYVIPIAEGNDGEKDG